MRIGGSNGVGLVEGSECGPWRDGEFELEFAVEGLAFCSVLGEDSIPKLKAPDPPKDIRLEKEADLL